MKLLILSLSLLFLTNCNSQDINPDSDIKLPPGFKIEVYAENVPNARSMTLTESGMLIVSTRKNDKVYAVIDNNKDNKADEVVVILSGLDTPNGVAVKDGALYIAEINRILRIDDIDNTFRNNPQPVVVKDDFPTARSHGWKFIKFGPDGKLYVPVGAPCNICLSDDPRFASITRMNADGTEFEIFAHGVRNTVGFDWHPDTDELWFTDNGRDSMGDDIPPDELNNAPTGDLHFGYPYLHGSNIPDPEFGEGINPSDFTLPARELGPHVAALGMRFYTGDMFPSEYRNQIFIAEHGSWDRSSKIGYRVTLVKLEGNTAVSYEPFAEGWLKGESVSGRPVDVEILPDGSMLVSDDYAGKIYRVSYEQ